MIELLTQILCDYPPAVAVDGAYLFAQTVDNQASVFEAGFDILVRKQAKKLLISAAGPISGYPGYKQWQHELHQLGINSADVAGIPPSTEAILHTRVEAEGLVRYLKATGAKTVSVISAPFHQLRCFMTVVSVALEEMPELKIYSQVGTSLPWHETVVHSQGTLQLKRSNLIKSELDRITTYQQKGDLVSTEAVYDYLTRRDRD
ncbi:MAG: YdcF family protein [Anaerolineae bacterium]|nr:YdcF family protein [Anaerolineae bacterium]